MEENYFADDQWTMDLAKYVFVEPRLAGKRILEVGCRDGTGIGFLRQCEASFICGLDRSAEMIEVAARKYGGDRVRIVHGELTELNLRAGSFDVVIVLDLFGQTEDPDYLLHEIHRILIDDGFLLTSCPSRERDLLTERLTREGKASARPGYYDFIHLLERHYAHVQAIGQSPFAAYSFIDLTIPPSEIQVAMDTSLLNEEGESAVDYLALCSKNHVRQEDSVVVQYPYSPFVERLVKYVDEIKVQSQRDEERDALIHRIEEKRSRLAQARRQLRERDKLLKNIESKNIVMERKLKELEPENAQLKEELKKCEKDRKKTSDDLKTIISVHGGCSETMALQERRYEEFRQSMEEELRMLKHTLDDRLRQLGGLTSERDEYRQQNEELSLLLAQRAREIIILKNRLAGDESSPIEAEKPPTRVKVSAEDNTMFPESPEIPAQAVEPDVVVDKQALKREWSQLGQMLSDQRQMLEYLRALLGREREKTAKLQVSLKTEQSA